jgi:hypothetical protein
MAESTISFAASVSLPLPLDVQFDVESLTSDGGLPWVREADEQLGLSSAFAAVIPEWRQGPVRHARETLVRQRLFQIACGYADQNDTTTLRTDPLLKLVCDRLPATDPDLASQPTLSRLENAVDRHACRRLAEVMLGIYLTERERHGRPRHLVLDLDGTDDPVHGKQEGGSYHGYYRQHMYFPLLIFDGETNQLLLALLRPGTVHASHGIVPILRVLVRRLRQRWPEVSIELRADSGFAIPALYEWCEREGIAYTIGLIPNTRLEPLAESLVAEAVRQRDERGVPKVRLASETSYQAGSWSQARRVVFKAEALTAGPNTRFVVTTRPDPPLDLYDWYVDRGEPEQWIKDLKRGCFADRLSCHHFWANQFRLLLHAAAYWLLDTVRRWLMAQGVPRMQLDTLRLRLIKIGGWVRQLLTRVHLHLARSHPGRPLWNLLAARPGRP